MPLSFCHQVYKTVYIQSHALSFPFGWRSVSFPIYVLFLLIPCNLALLLLTILFLECYFFSVSICFLSSLILISIQYQYTIQVLEAD